MNLEAVSLSRLETRELRFSEIFFSVFRSCSKLFSDSMLGFLVGVDFRELEMKLFERVLFGFSIIMMK